MATPEPLLVVQQAEAPVHATPLATPQGTDQGTDDHGSDDQGNNDQGNAAPVNLREPVTADVASEAPELLLLTALWVVPVLHADTPTRPPMHVLLQPLLEPPQRPPRPVSVHA